VFDTLTPLAVAANCRQPRRWHARPGCGLP
jgi:hypothetical protein